MNTVASDRRASHHYKVGWRVSNKNYFILLKLKKGWAEASKCERNSWGVDPTADVDS